MSNSTRVDVYWDPYDVEINTDPYPVFKRLREEAPLYYNEEHDFYAVSRFADVERGLKDRDTFISGRGGVLEIIKSGMEMPSGIVIFEDPPTHTIHRALLSRMFTPRQVARLEPQIRQFCTDALDPLVGSDGFDVIGELGAVMPARVIGMLMGLPDEDARGPAPDGHGTHAVGEPERCTRARSRARSSPPPSCAGWTSTSTGGSSIPRTTS